MASRQLVEDELAARAAGPGSDEAPQTDDDNESTGTLERAAQLGVTNGIRSEDGGEDEQAEAEDGNDDGGDYDSEDEDGAPQTPRRSKRRQHSQSEDDEDEVTDSDNDEEEADDDDSVANSEGVGAVKIRPGDTDEEEEEEDEDEESDAGSAAESETGDEEWDETVANGEEDDEEDEEAVVDNDAEDASEAEDEQAKADICVLCKQDETHGPGGETDNAFLTCHSCTNSAHTICASGNQETAQDTSVPEWRCPRCQSRRETGDEMEVDAEDQPVNGTTTTGALDANALRGSPALRSLVRAGDHAESSSGLRVLRKRKTSPIEAADDSIMSLRKRRRNTTEDGLNDLHNTAAGSIRPLRIKPAAGPSSSASSSFVTVEKKTRTSLILKMRVPGPELQRIFARKKRKYTKRGTAINPGRRKKQLGADDDDAVYVGGPMLLPSMPSATAYTQPFYSFFDKETEELKGKPYGGILSEAEADTSKTFPTADDRRRFDEAKQQAEAEWRARLLAAQAEETDAQSSPKKKKAAGPASQIECIEFGGWEIDTWYAAPYPEEYSRNRVLYICEFCLKYMNSDYVAWRHKLKCPAKHPPGDEIYRHESVSMFEVDGRKNPVYCQNLCLLAKLFLGSKTLYYDVEPFLFYVLCEYDDFGYHFVGYFSKEKRASSQNNVSCILTLPIHQRKGYGNLLMDFSYLLTRVEKRTGSPEKPLSDMGLVSYRNYWRLEMCRYLLRVLDEGSGDGAVGLSIKNISDDTGMTADDVISALEGLRCLVRDPQTGLYAFRVDVAYCREYVVKWERKKYVKLNPDALTWTPYVMGRNNASNFELGPALSAIAPREEDEKKAAEEYITSLATNGVNGEAADQDHGDGTSMAPADGTYPETGTVLESTEHNDDDETLPGHAENPARPGEENAGHKQKNADHPQGDDESQVPGLVVTNGDVNGHKGSDEGCSYMVQGSAGPGSGAGSGSGLSVRSTENGRGQSASDEDWAAAYDGIPTTRFVVYPPLTARGFNYARAPIGRPPGSRTGSGMRGRRHGYVRRSVVGSARSSVAGTGTGRRKTGGTGRGPGRWPKGTKKSDYGNAGSGPGLPPAWQSGDVTAAEDEKKEEATEAPDGQHAGDAATEDALAPEETAPGAVPVAEQEDDSDAAKDTVTVEVEVQTPVSWGKTEAAAAPAATTDKQNGVHGPAVLLATGGGFQGRSSPRLGKNKSGGTAGTALQDGEDTAMVDGGG